MAAQQTRVSTTSPSDSSGLAALHAAIRRFNPELIARRASVAAAEARLDAAGFAPVSVLSGEIEDVPGGVNVTRAGSARLTLDHEFLSSGRRTAVRSFASADVEATSAELYASERRVMALVSQALVSAAGWSAIARRLVEEDSLLSSAQASLRARFATGGARYVDVLRLRTERLRVETEQSTAATEASVAMQTLHTFVSPSDSLPPNVAIFLDSLATSRADALVAAGLARSQPGLAMAQLPPAPSVDSLLSASGVTRAADAALAHVRAARQLILAGQRPHLTGFLGAQRFLGDNGRFTVGPVVGGSLSLPFTARKASATATTAAMREVTAAQARRTATLSSLRADLLAARARYEAARARLAVYDAALLIGAREERETAVAAYRSGTLTLIELLDFERALSHAEIDRLRSQIDAATALAELLTGTSGLTAPAPQVSAAINGVTNAP